MATMSNNTSDTGETLETDNNDSTSEKRHELPIASSFAPGGPNPFLASHGGPAIEYDVVDEQPAPQQAQVVANKAKALPVSNETVFEQQSFYSSPVAVKPKPKPVSRYAHLFAALVWQNLLGEKLNQSQLFIVAGNTPNRVIFDFSQLPTLGEVLPILLKFAAKSSDTRATFTKLADKLPELVNLFPARSSSINHPIKPKGAEVTSGPSFTMNPKRQQEQTEDLSFVRPARLRM